MYENMGQYSKALECYEKAHEIWEKTFPANHPDPAGSHNNISMAYAGPGEYLKALKYVEHALDIFRKT